MVTSETCALDLVGAHYVRDVKPGEMIIIDNEEAEKITTVQDAVEQIKKAVE